MVSPTRPGEESSPSLLARLTEVIRQKTHDRIRGLAVEQVDGRVHIRGRALCQHSRQLALHAALGLVPTEGLSAEITVG